MINKNKQRGFLMIEMLLVVIIILALTLWWVKQENKAHQKKLVERMKQQTVNIMSGIMNMGLTQGEDWPPANLRSEVHAGVETPIAGSETIKCAPISGVESLYEYLSPKDMVTPLGGNYEVCMDVATPQLASVNPLWTQKYDKDFNGWGQERESLPNQATFVNQKLKENYTTSDWNRENNGCNDINNPSTRDQCKADKNQNFPNEFNTRSNFFTDKYAAVKERIDGKYQTNASSLARGNDIVIRAEISKSQLATAQDAASYFSSTEINQGLTKEEQTANSGSEPEKYYYNIFIKRPINVTDKQAVHTIFYASPGEEVSTAKMDQRFKCRPVGHTQIYTSVAACSAPLGQSADGGDLKPLPISSCQTYADPVDITDNTNKYWKVHMRILTPTGWHSADEGGRPLDPNANKIQVMMKCQ